MRDFSFVRYQKREINVEFGGFLKHPTGNSTKPMMLPLLSTRTKWPRPASGSKPPS
jgi:hypothetical protein